MFTINKCLVNICKNNALSSFDENGNLINGKGYCLDHAPDPGLAQSAILNYIRNNEKIIGLNARGMIFKDINGRLYLSVHSPNNNSDARKTLAVFMPIKEQAGRLVADINYVVK